MIFNCGRGSCAYGSKWLARRHGWLGTFGHYKVPNVLVLCHVRAIPPDARWPTWQEQLEWTHLGKTLGNVGVSSNRFDTNIWIFHVDISYGYIRYFMNCHDTVDVYCFTRVIIFTSEALEFWSTLRRNSDAASHGSLPTHEIMGFLRNLCPGFLGPREDEMMRWGWVTLTGGATSINELVLIKSRASISNQHVRS